VPVCGWLCGQNASLIFSPQKIFPELLVVNCTSVTKEQDKSVTKEEAAIPIDGKITWKAI